MTSKIKVDTIEEKTSGNGVNIDSVILKDGAIDVQGVSDGIILDADGDTTISADADDTIDFKTAGTDRMRIESGGNIGIGTSSASALLHIMKADSGALNDGNGDDLMLEGTSAVGMTIGSSNSGEGHIRFSDSDDADVCSISYFHSDDDLRFRVNASERMRIRSNGIVLIGTTSATNGQIEIKSTTTNAIKGYFANSTANFSNIRSFSDVGGTETETLRVENDGDVKNINNSYGSLSDERIKQDITDASSQWEDIKALKVKNYRRRNHVQVGLDYKMIGVIAQDLEEAGMSGLIKESIPSTGEIRANEIFGTIEEKQIYYDENDDEVQSGEKTINDVKDTVLEEKPSGETVKSVKYSVLYMKAIKALQEAMQRIETLEAEVSALKGE